MLSAWSLAADALELFDEEEAELEAGVIWIAAGEAVVCSAICSIGADLAAGLAGLTGASAIGAAKAVLSSEVVLGILITAPALSISLSPTKALGFKRLIALTVSLTLAPFG